MNNPIDADAYYNRGVSKAILEDYKGAIADCNKAIELNPNYTEAYYERGLSNFELNQLENACMDWSKAGELGHPKAYDTIKEYCNPK